MKREAKEKYAEISEAIEQAEKAELDRIMDNIASGSKKRLIRMPNNEFDIEMIYLRCRRIAIVLEYFRFRTPKQNAVLKKDCDDVIKMIAFNEYRLNTDKANVFEAADCVLALSGGGISKKDVVGVFSKQHPNDGTIYGENNGELPELLLNISSYLLKRGEEELALRLMRYLVEYIYKMMKEPIVTGSVTYDDVADKDYKSALVYLSKHEIFEGLKSDYNN